MESEKMPRRIQRAGSTFHVRILRSQWPERFSISAYQKVDEWGFPAGRARRLDTSLQRVVEDGWTVAWDVFFPRERAGAALPPERPRQMGVR